MDELFQLVLRASVRVCNYLRSDPFSVPASQIAENDGVFVVVADLSQASGSF